MEPEKQKINIEGELKQEDLSSLQEKIEKQGAKKEIIDTSAETVKGEIKDYIRELQIQASSLPVKNKRDEAKEISQFPQNQQIVALVSLVFEKGLKDAIEVARDINNPAILDEFHDILADKYYDELVKRGLIK